MLCMYPDAQQLTLYSYLTLVQLGVESMLCACTLIHQLRWLTLVDFGTGVEPMLCVYNLIHQLRWLTLVDFGTGVEPML